MSTVEQKIQDLQNGASYTLDFSLEEDRTYFVEKYGDLETLKKDFPNMYQCYLNAVKRDTDRKSILKNTTGRGCAVMLKGTTVAGTLKAVENSAEIALNETLAIQSKLEIGLGDLSNPLMSETPARKWPTAYVSLKIVRDDGLVMKKSNVKIEKANDHKGELVFKDQYALLEGHSYTIDSEITGIDPDSAAYVQISRDAVFATVKYPMLDVKLDDPIVKNSVSGKDKSKIMMLYGRYAQQEHYKYADYYGNADNPNDYYHNTFANGKVRLLIPLKGTITWALGYEPSGIAKTPGRSIERPFVNYSGKQYLYYRDRDDWGNSDLHTKVLSACTKSKKDGDYYKTAFAIVDPKPDKSENRSGLDWYIDVEGAQSEINQTIMLSGGFPYEYKTDLVKDSVQLAIISKEEAEMKEEELEYYTFYRDQSTIYIPPIVIYWGCFGKNSQIRLANGGECGAEQIKAGDQLMDYQGRTLTVADVVTGEDSVICHIKTDKGETKVSQGHALMDAEGCLIKAWKIKAGDRLTAADGKTAVVESVQIVEYNDYVYNFVFEEIETGTYLLADGLYSGDLNLQNARPVLAEQLFTEEDDAVIAEMRRFIEWKEGEQNRL